MNTHDRQSGLTRRAFLWATAGTAGVAAMGSRAPEAAAGGRPFLVQHGRAQSVIIVSPDADVQVRYAAEDLVRLVARSTGVTLPWQTTVDGVPAETLKVYVGFAGPGSHPDIASTLAGMDADGTLLALHRDTFTIIGQTSWSTRYAVNQFAEESIGVAWLMPTDVGEHVPPASQVMAPGALTVSNPTFTARTMYPAPPSQQSNWTVPATPLRKWGDDNRSHWRMHFHHALYVIFDSAKFGTSNPEYYPIINGERLIPATRRISGWNPRFLEPGTIDAAAAAAVTYFRTFPEAPSFSLGVTDGGGFSDEEIAMSGTNSLGMPDLSPIYWDWVNKVVEKVTTEHPEYQSKWFGGLAYHEVQDPPPFPLHPRVVPYLTYDRYHWVDPGLREKDLATSRAWSESASQLGWYDYMYGHSYAVPRVPLQLWNEVIDTAAANNVIGYMIELVHNWGEGAKPWALSRKMWDTSRSLVAEANRWYELAVGKASAAPLREYYELWEDFWMTRVPKTSWFEAGRMRTWFPYDTMGYLDAVTPGDIARSRSLLEATRDRTTTTPQRRRADALIKEFEYYEASALSYPRELGVPDTADEALAMIADLAATIDQAVSMAVRRKAVWTALQADPLHAKVGSPSYEGLGAAWHGWNTKTMIRIADFVNGDAAGADRVRAEVARLADDTSGSADLRGWAQHCLYMINGEKVSYGVNNGFEGGLTGWVFTPKPAVLPRAIETSTEYALEGSQSLRLPNGFTTVGVNQASPIVPVVDGVWVQQLRYRVPEGQTAHGVFVPGIIAYNAAGAQIGYRQDYYVPMSAATNGTWATARFSDRLPEGTATVRTVNVAAYFQTPGEVYVDDVKFELYAEPGSVHALDEDRMFQWPPDTSVVADPEAYGGTAVRMTGDRRTQAVHLNLSELPADGEWRVHVLVRLTTSEGADPASIGVEIGSYPKNGIELQTFPVSRFANGHYQLLTYTGTYRRDVSRYLHVSGRSPGVPHVYVDRFYLTKA